MSTHGCDHMSIDSKEFMATGEVFYCGTCIYKKQQLCFNVYFNSSIYMMPINIKVILQMCSH